jgi:hypothetical protein
MVANGSPDAPRGANDAQGEDASSPWRIPANGWKEVALRAWREAGKDNISLIASGVAFYGFFAMVPLLGAIVLSYGLIADGPTIIKLVQALTSAMPARRCQIDRRTATQCRQDIRKQEGLRPPRRACDCIIRRNEGCRRADHRAEYRL